MKKTIIALMALAGVATADTYTYIGKDTSGAEGWFESEKNWRNQETGQVMGSANNMSADNRNNTFIIANGKTVTSGTNAGQLSGATVTVEKSGSTLKVDNGLSTATLTAKDNGKIQFAADKYISNSTITVESTGVLSVGKDAKMSNVVINSEAAITIGNTWFDGNGACGNLTFNLGNSGSVTYGNFNFNADEYKGTITLNAICQDGYINGTGEIMLKERTLLTVSGFTKSGGNGTITNFLNDHVASSLKLGGTSLTLSNTTFDSASLSSEDVGKYCLIQDGNSIKVQYVAYADAIPEPTTATLSLLALAGLAARRRRR